MNRKEISEKLKAIIEPYSQDSSQFEGLSEQTDLLRDLKINSAHLVDIIHLQRGFSLAGKGVSAIYMTTL